MIKVDKFQYQISIEVPPDWDLCFVLGVRNPLQRSLFCFFRETTWEVMALQNTTSQKIVKIGLEEHQHVLITICVASLILGLPMAYNTLDHLKESC